MSDLSWNPDRITILRINDRDTDRETAWKAFRGSSSGYASKKYVRLFVFLFGKDECNNCGNKGDLQIDHIKSVYSCFLSKEYELCNTVKNLQVLCAKCNNIKSHYDV